MFGGAKMATPIITPLAKLCRICGELCDQHFKVSEHCDRLSKAFLVEFKVDSPDIHPQNVCHRCYSTPWQTLKWEKQQQHSSHLTGNHMLDIVPCVGLPNWARVGASEKRKGLEDPVNTCGQGASQTTFWVQIYLF